MFEVVLFVEEGAKLSIDEGNGANVGLGEGGSDESEEWVGVIRVVEQASSWQVEARCEDECVVAEEYW